MQLNLNIYHEMQVITDFAFSRTTHGILPLLPWVVERKYVERDSNQVVKLPH